MDCESERQVENSGQITLEFFSSIVYEIVDRVFLLKNNFADFQQQVRNNHIDEETMTSDTSYDELQEELDALQASDEEPEGNPETKYKTKNEIVQPKPFKEIEETNEERYKRYNLDPNQIQNLDLMGTITSIMSDYIVVESRNYQVLDLDNILFTQDKMILGQIDDVFGRIEVPVYSIINDGFLMKQVREGKIKVGDGVYYDREHSRILPQEQINLLRSKKGTDASNKFDEEVLLEEEIEFSDDEKEEAYRAERAALKKAQKKAQSNTNPSKPKKAEKSEKKLVQQAQKMNSTIVYNQGMAYAIQPTYIMPQQPMPMNMMMMNPGMMAQPLAQPLFYPMQNAPLQFNPMFNQNNMVNNTGYTPQPLLGQQPQFFQNGFNNNNSNTLNKGFFN